MSLEAIADEAVNVAAIAGLVILAVNTQADPTTVTMAVAGLGGYRMRQRSAKPSNGSDGN